MAVSLAGPLSNLLLAVVLALVLRLAPVDSSGIWPGLAFLALLQVTAVVLNLIPVPPFDGFGAVEPHLKEEARIRIAPIRGAMIWIVFLLLWYVPIINRMFWNFTLFLSRLIGVPQALALNGMNQFLFWR